MFQTLQTFFTTSPVHADIFAHSLWLIIALPLIGALINGVAGKALGRANVNLIALTTVGASFVLALIAFWAVNDPHVGHLAHDYGLWFGAGNFQVHFGLAVDHLTGVMLLVVTGVGFLIFVYATGYMAHDPAFWRFFCYLSLFLGMMLTLVLADSLVLLFVGWEGVGFCSYLLVGFWYTDIQKAQAGRKAFICNRVGDFGFIIAMALLVILMGAAGKQLKPANVPFAWAGQTTFVQTEQKVGPLSFEALREMAEVIPAAPPKGQHEAVLTLKDTIQTGPLKGHTFGGVLTVVLFLLLLGATGKSAQLPLYVWLPDAMAGPTPVSALMHAATMVTAGVYLFCRLSFLLVFSPAVMTTLAMVGALTAVFAAIIAFAQNDLKKILAYSTISQLGYMFLGVGMGVFWAAILHLVTHAFFKACLFLGAGSVMHANDDCIDIKRLGGVRKEMPWTALTFGIATLAITGIVPLSGFFSKDAILGGAHATTIFGHAWVGSTVWGLGLLGAFFTAFYMTRAYWLTFEGKRSENAPTPHCHESPWNMTLPMAVLAVLSIAAIAYGLPVVHVDGESMTVMQYFLRPAFQTAASIGTSAHSFAHGAEGSPILPWVMAWIIVLLGGGLAGFLYTRYFPARKKDQPVPAFARAVHQVTFNKFYVDELYGTAVVGLYKTLSRYAHKLIDETVIDSWAVRGTAKAARFVGSGLRRLQTGDVQSYAAAMAVAVLIGVVYALIQVLR